MATNGHHYEGDLPASAMGDPANNQPATNVVGATTIAKQTLKYDARGLVVEKSSAKYNSATPTVPPTTVVDYTYDNFAQMQSATTTKPGEDPDTRTFTYDGNGNPATSSDDIGAFNRLNRDAHGFYEYDDEGNLVKRWRYDEHHATGIYEAVPIGEEGDTFLATFDTDLETWEANAYYSVRLTELRLEAPNQTLGQNDSYLLGSVNFSFDGPCYPLTGGVLTFTLHEVEENGTVYLDLSSSETYWLRVGGGGTDNLKAEINLALNPPNGEEIVSGKFVAQAHSYLDVFDWDYHNRLTAVTHYVAGSGNDTVTMPDGGTTTMNEVYTKHYVYDVHDRLIYEHIIDTDTPTDKRNEAVYVHERGRRVAVFEKSSGVPGTRYRS